MTGKHATELDLVEFAIGEMGESDCGDTGAVGVDAVGAEDVALDCGRAAAGACGARGAGVAAAGGDDCGDRLGGDFRAVPEEWVGGADDVGGAPERDGAGA